MGAHFNVPASAELAERGIVGEEELRRIDEFLAGRRPDQELDPWVISLDTGVPEAEVKRAMDEYLREGILSGEEVMRCSKCKTSAPAEPVYEARGDGDTYPCPGGCEEDLAADSEAEELLVYVPKHELPKLA